MESMALMCLIEKHPWPTVYSYSSTVASWCSRPTSCVLCIIVWVRCECMQHFFNTIDLLVLVCYVHRTINLSVLNWSAHLCSMPPCSVSYATWIETLLDCSMNMITHHRIEAYILVLRNPRPPLYPLPRTGIWRQRSDAVMGRNWSKLTEWVISDHGRDSEVIQGV